MGERKVLNKYFPPDFDPALMPKGKRKVNNQWQVRMMLPMSVCCTTCSEYMYQGKKFNSKCEQVGGPEGKYLGIQRLRFYMKCCQCNAEFTITTDPKNSGYICETGVARNFELWKEREDHNDTAKQQREDAEEGNAMKALELRTEDSKREMDALDALDEIKAINKRHIHVNMDQVLDLTHDKKLKESTLEAEDEVNAKEMFQKKRKELMKNEEFDVKVSVNWDKDHASKSTIWNSSSMSLSSAENNNTATTTTGEKSSSKVTIIKKLKKVKKKKKRKYDNSSEDILSNKKTKTEVVAVKPAVTPGVLSLGLGGYGSSSGSE